VSDSNDLIILGSGGSPANHYRMRGGKVRFRAIGRHSVGLWRTLSEQDIFMHLLLNTQVAEWLYARSDSNIGTLHYRAA